MRTVKNAIQIEQKPFNSRQCYHGDLYSKRSTAAVNVSGFTKEP